ncbi:hypothetical protein HK103_002560 [Boothiomyces macroporosus]|uniref:Uncharacterized protein n=1 Tax=Boothiomyces macroporosus TaxID=261099 RepID=A0AAD5U9K8_9FUNG|nr:hypothetical protein HK103_002560 [Boothiomyces macroporosus]
MGHKRPAKKRNFMEQATTYYDPEAARTRIESILNSTPTSDVIQTAPVLNYMEPLDPIKRDPTYDFKKRINENQEVDRRLFVTKALPSLVGISLALLLALFSYFILPGDADKLSYIQTQLAIGNVKIGSWTISVHSVVAAIVTFQGMLLGLAVAISTPLLTWYYITKVGVPYTFIDSSKSVVGSLRAIKSGAKDFKPYIFVSIIYLVSLIFRSADNIALSSFIFEAQISEFGKVQVYDTSSLTDFNPFYLAVKTDDPVNAQSDIVLAEGSQPFHSALGSVSNGNSNAEISSRNTSNILACDSCEASVQIAADYNITCVPYSEPNNGTAFINSTVHGIFAKGPIADQQVYFRVGVRWYVSITDGENFNHVNCTIWAANSTRYESSAGGTQQKDVGTVHSIELIDRYDKAFKWPVELPYDSTITYEGAEFPSVPLYSGSLNNSYYYETPLPFYVIGSYSLMLQRYGFGKCQYEDFAM